MIQKLKCIQSEPKVLSKRAVQVKEQVSDAVIHLVQISCS